MRIMKKTLLASLLLVSLSAAAQSETVSVVANMTGSADWISELPGVVSVSPMFDGYVKIVMDEASALDVRQQLDSARVPYELDAEVLRAPIDVQDFSAADAGPLSQVQAAATADPLQSMQTELFSSLNNALLGMQNQRKVTGEADRRVKVLIMDTGSLPHEDVSFKGGYSFVLSPRKSPLPNAPVRQPHDYEDYTIDSSCRSGHGLAMAGIVAAGQYNKVGITGVANADLYMARVVETECASGKAVDKGELSDLAAALASVSKANGPSGIPVPDVINISLAAEVPCPVFLQNSINAAVSAGAVVVVSAGNNAGLSAAQAPANCQNVITVAAHSTTPGSLAPYSNYGAEVDVAVLGLRYTTVHDNTYGYVEGTSGAAAAVSGLAALLKQQYPNATPAQIELILKEGATPYPAGGACTTLCGKGMVDFPLSMTIADHLLDPKITFRHGFHETSGDTSGNCKINSEQFALSTAFDSCSALVSKIDTHFTEFPNPLKYKVDLRKRRVGLSTWDISTGVTSVTQYDPDMNKDALPLFNPDTSNYEYAMIPCFTKKNGSVSCPSQFVTPLDPASIVKPANCK